MHDGSGAGLTGSWHADQYLFNASEYATTSPSSPSWPSSTNFCYTNWGEDEPMLSYGVVGITPPPLNECDCGNTSTFSPPPASAAGMWIFLDPRSAQPFLCSYLNDGSVFPALPPTAMLDLSSEPSPEPSPSEYCLSGWSYLALTSRGYRVYPSASTATGADLPVTAAFTGKHCAQVLRGRVAVTKLGYVHAVAIQTVRESFYVGSLLRLYLESSGNGVAVPARDGSRSISAASPLLPVNLAGVSFVENGTGGLHLRGVRELSPLFADNLGAAGEPANAKGCAAVDTRGLWYYIPCSRSTSPSMPESEAVQVLAYTSQYHTSDIDPKKDPIPVVTTPPPTPTSGPDSSSDSGSGSRWLPLGQRVEALSGAVHVVVAAGSSGIYALQDPNATIAPSASVRGLHFFFAPLSAYYIYPAPGLSVDNLLSVTTAGESPPFSPCDEHKDQSRIARVRANATTVHHTNHSEVG
ncbi:hypothetical protein CUR178_07938 [Leishmania enriettii]|uniref:C-type lectin domain-containing protein n=1 Tax=Leishmania enriettii TaxID=5663 RepID=A0A836H489_LEIEN|nr:hypothetical protein CUR178_07938 [Leishmania enriettii]